ncbi:MAG: phosphoglucosamine mutase [Sphingomonadales bacterium]
MTRRYFGTDGIRGTANSEPMTAEIALRVGMAAGRQFKRGDYRHRVVIGKDTRLSGYMFEPALTAGFVAVGMDVILVGPMPTPAVAMLTGSLRADLGVMITASHNPHHDNGIKLFGPDGYKLSDDVEAAIEARMDNGYLSDLAAPADLGRAKRLDDAEGRYIEFAKKTFPAGLTLEGMKIVVDCAHGAAYKVAPTILWELGADVIPIGVEPDGFNINDGCGSTATERMRQAVVDHGAHIGIALDGDADRLMVSDEKGNIIDGDQLLAVIAGYWQGLGRLRGDRVVATVMSNLGLERHLLERGVELVRTRVGDRYVVEEMRTKDLNVGGEQSGHIVLRDFATTGDGIIAALQLLSVVVGKGRPVSEICRVFEPLPQLLRNVRYSGPCPLDDKSVQQAIADGEGRLNGSGRLLIRLSGTEPVVRVMAEGEDEGLIASVVDNVITTLHQRGR